MFETVGNSWQHLLSVDKACGHSRMEREEKQMRFKKVSAAILTMAMAATMPMAAFAEEKETKSIEPTEVVFWHGMSNKQEETLTELTDRFNEENEYGITVKLVNQGNYGDLSKKLIASAAADELPDLAQAYNNWLTDFTDKIVPLDDFVAEDMDDYEDLVEGYRAESEQLGCIGSLPFNKSTYVYFYNKTMFDELGLEAPKTWEDMIHVGEVFKEEKDMPAFGVDDLAGFLEASLAQNESEYASDEGALFDNEVGLETVEYIMNLYNNGYARLIGEDDYFSTVISSQRIGGYIGSSTGVSYITADDFELAAAPLPINKKAAANQAGTNIVMFSKDENQQNATWEYMKYLVSTEATTEWAMKTGYLPVRVSAFESDEYQAFMAEDFTAQAAYAQVDSFFPAALFKASNSVRNAVNTGFEEIVLEELSPEEALEEFVEIINDECDVD
jgi:multiple sugar transport system substrate-binding protein